MSEDSSGKSWGLRFFSNPIVGIIGWLATVLSLILTIYFYKAGKDARDLTYFVHPIKTVLVRASQASRLTTEFDGKRVQGDITAVQVALWNKGNLAIKRENLLKPIILYTGNNTPILEATLRKQSRDVIGISLATENLQQGRLAISWNILEGNDGCIIQLIYAGNPETSLSIEGVVEGQKQIEHVRYSREIPSPNEQFVSDGRLSRMVGFFLLASSVFLLSLAIYMLISRDRRRSSADAAKEYIEQLKSLDASGLEIERYKEAFGKTRRDRGLISTADRLVSLLTSPRGALIMGLLYLGLGLFVLFESQEIGPPFGF